MSFVLWGCGRNRKMVVPAQTQSTTDEFSSRHAELIESGYDCIDRIVINAYNSLYRPWRAKPKSLAR